MTTPKTIRLKTCPRCGETAPEMHYTGAYHKWRVICPKCGLHTTFYSRLADAVRRWNTRVVTDNETVFVNVDGVYVEKVKKD